MAFCPYLDPSVTSMLTFSLLKDLGKQPAPKSVIPASGLHAKIKDADDNIIDLTSDEEPETYEMNKVRKPRKVTKCFEVPMSVLL
jgi:hypothetical protein